MTIQKIADDIFQLRLPLPFALNHVNVYLLRGKAGWTVVDTGLNTPEARATWQAAFAELNLTPKDMEQIILTHIHPDHFGMVGWLQELAAESGRVLPVRTSPREAYVAQEIWLIDRTGSFPNYLVKGGMAVETAREVADSFIHTRNLTFPHPARFDVLPPGETVCLGERQFQIIPAPGHSDGQIIFYDADDKLLLSGDHVLMKITPNIGLWEDSAPDPLGDFMKSLHELEPLDVRLALPGHRALITDWAGRLDELQAHHIHRLALVMEAIEKGNQTAFAVAQHIFEVDRFTVHEWRFAIAETLAHLEYLRLRGKLTRQDGEIWHYQRTG